MTPKYPSSDEIASLLEKVHAKDVPNWTTKETEQVYHALQALMFYWFRKEVPDVE